MRILNKMHIVFSLISLLAGMTGLLGIYAIHKRNMEKKRDGRPVSGKKTGCEEITGRPVRYIVEVEYQLDHKDYTKKIVTTDKRIRRYENNEPIPLLYVDSVNKVFWAEDNSKEWLVHIVLLAVFCGFMFLLSGICLVL